MADDPAELKTTCDPTSGLVGETVKRATGAADVVTLTAFGDVDTLTPYESLTVSTTLYVPASS